MNIYSEKSEGGQGRSWRVESRDVKASPQRASRKERGRREVPHAAPRQLWLLHTVALQLARHS